MTITLEEAKQRARASWAAGDYDRVADHLWAAGERIVRRVGVADGEQVLDLACGTGNAAIRAAEAGGDVVGLDLTPELFEAARVRAAAAGVDVDWVEGDAEALPFAEESFDVVLSTFGVLWVPRHQVTVDEIVRVLRPGGRIGLANWTPSGMGGEFFKITARHMPPPPPFADPAPMWGDEDYVSELFAGTGVELEFLRENVVWRWDSLDGAVEAFTTDLGPLVKARELLEPQGRWQALHDDIAAYFERGNEGTNGEFALPGEYLVVLGRKSG